MQKIGLMVVALLIAGMTSSASAQPLDTQNVGTVRNRADAPSTENPRQSSLGGETYAAGVGQLVQVRIPSAVAMLQLIPPISAPGTDDRGGDAISDMFNDKLQAKRTPVSSYRLR